MPHLLIPMGLAFGVGLYIATKTKNAEANVKLTRPANQGISPTGYKPASSVPKNVVDKSVELLKQPLGYEEYVTGDDGKSYFIRVEVHTYYGADPSKPHKDHKGSTVYVQK